MKSKKINLTNTSVYFRSHLGTTFSPCQKKKRTTKLSKQNRRTRSVCDFNIKMGEGGKFYH